MEELHAAIADYLRAHRRCIAAESAAAPPIVGPSVTPALRTPRAAASRSFVCRFCAQRTTEGEHGERFHFAELLEAVSCAECHHQRLRHEETKGGPYQLLRQGWYHAGKVTPRCRQCGEPLRDGGGLYEVEKLRALRECSDCYMPF